MPVWHELTKAWREQGRLAVVGIAQEQHPQRCQLFAQWHQIDWPILWDSFNRTRSAVVPRFILIDEHGIVRSLRADPSTIEETFLDVEFPRPGDQAEKEAKDDGLRGVFELLVLSEDSKERARLAEQGLTPFDRAAETAVQAYSVHPDEGVPDPARLFALGVALRMRYDSRRAQAGDFQSALDNWRRALDANPNQYIWRRRIQQYGPLLDKPYPFYDWIDQARTDIAERGETPVGLRVALTGSERAVPSSDAPRPAPGQGEEPDPLGRITRDETLINVETAVAFDTSRGRPVARVHVALRPQAAAEGHWNNEVGPLVVWIGDANLSEGWQLDSRLLTHPNPPQPVSDELRSLDFEIHLPAGTAGTHELPGYALFYACAGVDGTCVYRRRDFTISLHVPE